MSADSHRPIDWSHEREWRWVDHQDRFSCPGLPIWLSEDEPTLFSRVFVVVPNEAEVERVLDRLKELYDAEANDYDFLFSRQTLKATSVIALDQLETELNNTEFRNLRIEDIPTASILDFELPKATPELVEKVRSVLAEARTAADQAAAAYLKSAPRDASGRYVADIAGWANLSVLEAQSPLVSALLELGEASPVPGTGYYISKIGGLGWREHQELSLAEAAVEAARSVFEEHFPDSSFGIETRWD